MCNFAMSHQSLARSAVNGRNSAAGYELTSRMGQYHGRCSQAAVDLLQHQIAVLLPCHRADLPVETGQKNRIVYAFC